MHIPPQNYFVPSQANDILGMLSQLIESGFMVSFKHGGFEPDQKNDLGQWKVIISGPPDGAIEGMGRNPWLDEAMREAYHNVPKDRLRHDLKYAPKV